MTTDGCRAMEAVAGEAGIRTGVGTAPLTGDEPFDTILKAAGPRTPSSRPWVVMTGHSSPGRSSWA
ncbi:hypothetical protein [uncultured Methylobacterium sp.]|uniref:hypothetical protein n=1 Tax=uncultured Methylobacterium sp. TaxID=157278 RepID=UPI0035CAE40C